MTGNDKFIGKLNKQLPGPASPARMHSVKRDTAVDARRVPASGRNWLRFVRCFPLLVVGLLSLPAFATDKPAPPKLAIDVILYPYQHKVDDDTDLSLTINAPLPARFSYFSFLNLRGVIGDGGITLNRTEQNLRWALAENFPVDLNLQAIIIEGAGNDVWQLGLGWRLDDTPYLKSFFDRINLSYRLTLHFKRFSSGDDTVWQMEHYFRMTFPWISERLYLSGFLDQTFDRDLPDAFPKNPIVTEIQLGVRLFDRFYAVTEYRINENRLSREHNLAAGVEYKFRF